MDDSKNKEANDFMEREMEKLHKKFFNLSKGERLYYSVYCSAPKSVKDEYDEECKKLQRRWVKLSDTLVVSPKYKNVPFKKLKKLMIASI